MTAGLPSLDLAECEQFTRFWAMRERSWRCTSGDRCFFCVHPIAPSGTFREGASILERRQKSRHDANWLRKSGLPLIDLNLLAMSAAFGMAREIVFISLKCGWIGCRSYSSTIVRSSMRG